MKAFLALIILSVATCQVMVGPEGSEKCLVDRGLHEELMHLKCELRLTAARTTEELRNTKERLQMLEEKVQYNTEERQAKLTSTFLARGFRGARWPQMYNFGDTLVFTKAVYNQGGNYDATTGVYTCPVNGTYSFTFALDGAEIKNGGDSLVQVGLVKSDSIVGDIYFYNSGTDNLGITQSVVVECYSGERVSVKAISSNTRIYGSPYINVFSGFLITRL